MLRCWEVAPRLWWWLPPHCQPQHSRFSKSCCDGSKSRALRWMLVDVGISDSCLFLFCCHAYSGLFGQCFVVRLGSILIFHSLLLGCLRRVNSNSTSNKHIWHCYYLPYAEPGKIYMAPSHLPRPRVTLPSLRLFQDVFQHCQHASNFHKKKTQKTIAKQRKSLMTILYNSHHTNNY